MHLFTHTFEKVPEKSLMMPVDLLSGHPLAVHFVHTWKFLDAVASLMGEGQVEDKNYHGLVEA